MSKEQHDTLVAVGINPDHVLHSSLKKVMRKFAEKFHPGAGIAIRTIENGGLELFASRLAKIECGQITVRIAICRIF